jgi:hypothetical protein
MKALFEFVIYLILGRQREETHHCFSACNFDVAFEAIQIQLPDSIAGKNSCPVLQYFVFIFVFLFSFSFLFSFFFFFYTIFISNMFLIIFIILFHYFCIICTGFRMFDWKFCKRMEWKFELRLSWFLLPTSRTIYYYKKIWNVRYDGSSASNGMEDSSWDSKVGRFACTSHCLVTCTNTCSRNAIWEQWSTSLYWIQNRNILTNGFRTIVWEKFYLMSLCL